MNVILCIMFSLSICPLNNYIYEGLRVPFANSHQFSSVQSLSHVQIFVTHGLQDARFHVHQQLLELTQTHVLRAGDAIQPSHSCHPLLLPSILPSIRVFSMSRFFASGGQSIGISASASVLPMNIQDLFPLGLITKSGLKI